MGTQGNPHCHGRTGNLSNLRRIGEALPGPRRIRSAGRARPCRASGTARRARKSLLIPDVRTCRFYQRRLHQLGVGAVLGAAAGGVIGHQFGGGTGRDVATVLGAIGGGLAGNAIQNRYVDRRPGQHIFVRLDSGASVAITQAADPALRVGDRVFIQGGGTDARVVRA